MIDLDRFIRKDFCRWSSHSLDPSYDQVDLDAAAAAEPSHIPLETGTDSGYRIPLRTA